MIIFNETKRVKEIVKAGSITEKSVKNVIKDLRLVISHFIDKGKNDEDIIEKIYKYAFSYFDGCNNEYVQKSLKKLISDVHVYKIGQQEKILKRVLQDGKAYEPIKSKISKVTIYNEELDIIDGLETEKLRLLAFVFLVYAKWMGYKQFDDVTAGIFDIAKISTSTSGTAKDDLIHRLVQKIIAFKLGQIVSTAYSWKRDHLNKLQSHF